jgi:hypothetical protein
MCGNYTQASPIDPALAVTNDSTDHATPLEAPELTAIPVRTEASPEVTALAAIPARTVGFCFTTLDGNRYTVQVAANVTAWNTS